MSTVWEYLLKIGTFCFFNAEMCLEDVEGMANSIDSDQTALFGAV